MTDRSLCMKCGGYCECEDELAQIAPACERCGGSGWLEAIGPKSDGSYITSRPCPRCDSGPVLKW